MCAVQHYTTPLAIVVLQCLDHASGTHCFLNSGASPGRKQWGGQKARVGLMASAEREPITGVQGQSPWSGGQGVKLP